MYTINFTNRYIYIYIYMDDEIPYLSYEIAGNRWHFLHGASIQYVIYLPFSARMGFRNAGRIVAKQPIWNSVTSFVTLVSYPLRAVERPSPPSKTKLRKSSTKGVSQLVFTNRLCQTFARISISTLLSVSFCIVFSANCYPTFRFLPF